MFFVVAAIEIEIFSAKLNFNNNNKKGEQEK